MDMILDNVPSLFRNLREKRRRIDLVFRSTQHCAVGSNYKGDDTSRRIALASTIPENSAMCWK